MLSTLRFGFVLLLVVSSHQQDCSKDDYWYYAETDYIKCTDLSEIYTLDTLIDTIALENPKLQLECINCNFPNLTSGHFPTNATTLKLNNCNISEVGKIPFEHLTTLEALHLDDNDIWNLTENVFEPLVSLDILSLRNNNLSVLTVLTFGGLVSLRYLHLEGNQIESISPEVLRPLIDLQYLYLDYNNISILENETFAHVPKLKVLSISHNNIEDVDELAFNSGAIESLYLNDNALISLPRQFFAHFNFVTYMDLSRNQLTFEDVSFEGLKMLLVLYLEHNNIAAIRPLSFVPLTDLTILVLSNNKITHLRSGTFLGLNKLRRLYLNGNLIQVVDGNAFQGLSSVEKLYLQDNLLEKCLNNDALKGLLKLKELLVERNNVTCIAPSSNDTLILDGNYSYVRLEKDRPLRIIYDTPKIKIN